MRHFVVFRSKADRCDYSHKFSKAVLHQFLSSVIGTSDPWQVAESLGSEVDDADKLYKGGGFKDVTLPTGQILEDITCFNNRILNSPFYLYSKAKYKKNVARVG